MIEIKDRDKYCNQFIDTFHFQLNWCAEVMPISQWKELKTLIGLNIFKFEERMREKGYKDGSLKEYVESKYWKEASVLIDKLL
jgi:hypothetical protein